MIALDLRLDGPVETSSLMAGWGHAPDEHRARPSGGDRLRFSSGRPDSAVSTAAICGASPSTSFVAPLLAPRAVGEAVVHLVRQPTTILITILLAWGVIHRYAQPAAEADEATGDGTCQSVEGVHARPTARRHRAGRSPRSPARSLAVGCGASRRSAPSPDRPRSHRWAVGVGVCDQ